MSDPRRQLAFWAAFVETQLGFEAKATEDGDALLFHDDDVVYVLHNTAAYDPGLIDMTVCVPSREDQDVKEEVCRTVVQDVPCLRAWVDEDGDIVLNVQSIAAGMRLAPRAEQLREVVPRVMDLLRYAVMRVNQDTTLAGIARSSCPLDGADNSHDRRGPRRG